MGISPAGLGLIAVPVLLSLTLHEFGHARMALAFGDTTARDRGRVSLNPLVHLDVMGTLCFLFGPVGWAKPVPVDPGNLHPQRLGNVAVSLAGVGMNVALTLLAAGGLTLMSQMGMAVRRSGAATPAGIGAFMLSFMMILNINLIVFNLIPLFPLDGHHVLREILPARWRAAYMGWQHRAGRFMLLALLLIPWLMRLLGSNVSFNPIGSVLQRVSFPVIRRLLTDEALILAADALQRYSVYLPY